MTATPSALWLGDLVRTLESLTTATELYQLVDLLLPPMARAFDAREAAIELVHRHDSALDVRTYWRAGEGAGELGRVASDETDPIWQHLRPLLSPAASTGLRSVRLSDGAVLLVLTPSDADGGIYIGPARALDPVDIEPPLLEWLSLHLSVAIDRLLFRQAAQRDELTGTLSRRTIFQHLEEQLERCGRLERPLSVALVGIDRLDELRTRHGQLTSDRLLRELARLVRAALPEEALIGRYGSHELLIVVPEVDVEATQRLLEALTDAVRDLEIDVGVGRRTTSTVSVGLLTMDHGTHSDSTSAEGLLAVVDFALTRAKQLGGDRLEQWSWRSVDIVDVEPTPGRPADPSS